MTERSSKQKQLAAPIIVTSVVGIAAVAKLRQRHELRQVLRKIWHILRQRFRLSLPSWPPSPEVLIKKGGIAAILSVALLWSSGLCTAASNEEDEEGRTWVATARRERRKVLEDLVCQVSLSKLCTAVPGLQPFVANKLGEQKTQIEQVAGSTDDSVVDGDFGIDAESIADAAEKLARVDCDDTAVWEAYAIAAALTAVELKQRRQDLEIAVLSDKGAELAPEMRPGGPELDALQMRISEAEELASSIAAQCPTWRTARRIAALYQASLWSAGDAVRLQRRAQWRCVMQVLWHFKSTLPFIGLSSLLSIVLGAFSAMRLHYQSVVINIAKDSVVTMSAGTAVSSSSRSSVGETIAAMIVSELITQIAEFGRARLTLRGKTRVIRELKAMLFQSLLRQDLAYLETCDLYQLRSLIGSCGTTVGQVIDFPAILIESSIRLLTAILMLWRKSSNLTSFLAVVLPVRYVLSHCLDRLNERLDQQACLPDFRGQINSCWSALVRPAALRTMRSFAREPVEVATFARFLAAQDRLQERGQLIYRLLEPLRTILEHGPEIGALWYGGRLAVKGEVEFGDLSSFVLVGQNAFEGARFVRAAAATASMQLGPLAQMAGLLVKQPRIGLDYPPMDSMPHPDSVKWNFKFENVHFAYPQRQGAWVLRGLSFEIKDGEFLGILGTTGAGKSTIFALLLRLYDPAEGRILLDGKNLREYNPLWLRHNIGVVTQDLVLCEKTVRGNLIYGCIDQHQTTAVQEVPDAQAREALRIAQCEDTFCDAIAFPNGWHTDVGDSGSNLSGGERQRLAIARAVLKNCKLLLLDEATSALDELSQARLQSALESFRNTKGSTLACIAHRLSNLSKADRLVVLSNGQAVEEGSPAELLAKPDSLFAEYARVHSDSVSPVVSTES